MKTTPILRIFLLAFIFFSLSFPSSFGKKKVTTKKSAADTTAIQDKKTFSSPNSMLQVTKEKEAWFFQIPDSLLGRLLLAVTRYTATPAGIGVYGGEKVADQAVYFELSPDKDKIFLKSNILYSHSDTLDAINKAVHNASLDPIIAGFKIENKSKKGYKINVTSLFLSDNCFSLPSKTRNNLHMTSPVSEATYIESIRSYPINTEIKSVRTYHASNSTVLAGEIANTISVGLNTSFVLLPKEPMQPRIFDARVGYFTDQYNIFSDDQQKVMRQRFITRYRLEPKEEDIEKMKKGELVEPRKQIVYYIDPATPKKWRPYLIAGVKDWNKAFEKAGFKNAITAKEWPENDSTMSLEDARFSVIRYLASNIPNAYGPQIHDPRSGEIIESHVGWYHNVMSLVHDWYMIQAGNSDPQARSMKFNDELMGQLIRFVSSHEIGHTLGLRHNFGSSSTVPVEKLRDRNWVKEHGHTPSIMDYARFNYVAQPEDSMAQADLFPRINDYDCWAIEWGYKPIFEATDSESDRFFLDKTTTQRLAGNPRLWWGDGEGYRSDPRCQTEDLGDDAVLASKYGIRNLQAMIEKLPEWTYWGNDTNDENLTYMYDRVYDQFVRYCGHVRKYVSGTYFNKKTVNEPGNRYEMTPREKEKTVLPFFNEYVFNEPLWLTNPSFIQRIVKSKEGTYTFLSNNIVAPLVSNATLESLNSNYPISEYLPELQNMLFKELATRKKVSSYRQMLQRTFVNQLVQYFNSHKDNAGNATTAFVLYTLKDLCGKTGKAAKVIPDKETKAHYIQLSDQISRALAIQ